MFTVKFGSTSKERDTWLVMTSRRRITFGKLPTPGQRASSAENSMRMIDRHNRHAASLLAPPTGHDRFCCWPKKNSEISRWPHITEMHTYRSRYAVINDKPMLLTQVL